MSKTKTKSEIRDERVTIRMGTTMRDALVREADRDGRSMADTAHRFIAEALGIDLRKRPRLRKGAK
jgi:hypothetical protein